MLIVSWETGKYGIVSGGLYTYMAEVVKHLEKPITFLSIIPGEKIEEYEKEGEWINGSILIKDEAQGIKYYFLPVDLSELLTDKYQYWSAYPDRLHLMMELSKENDIILIHDDHLLPFLLKYKPILMRSKLVFFIHNHKYIDTESCKAIDDIADKIVYNSNLTKREFITKCRIEDDLFDGEDAIIYPPTPEVKIKPDKGEAIEDSEFLSVVSEAMGDKHDKALVYLSRPEPDKGYVLLLRAFKVLLKRYSDKKPILFLAGRDELGVYDALAKSIPPGLSEHIAILQNISDREKYLLLSVLSGNGLFVFPARNEPFGIVVSEALSVEMPTVLGVETGASEYYIPWLHTIPIDDYSPTSLADTLEMTLDLIGTGYLRRITKAGYYRAMNNTGLSVANSIMEIINTV